MHRAVQAKSGAVNQLRVENVGLFYGNKLPVRQVIYKDIIVCVRLRRDGLVVLVGASHTILVGKLVIDSDVPEVF